MQYLLGLSKFTEKPVFVPELFVLIRKRLDQDFFVSFSQKQAWRPSKRDLSAPSMASWEFCTATSLLGQDKYDIEGVRFITANRE